MELLELNDAIKGKKFFDQNDTTWKFIAENTLRWGYSLSNSTNFSFFEENGTMYLKHGNAFGTPNDMKVAIENESPLKIILTDRFNENKIYTLTEDFN